MSEVREEQLAEAFEETLEELHREADKAAEWLFVEAMRHLGEQDEKAEIQQKDDEARKD